jgi:hypothetical protein
LRAWLPTTLPCPNHHRNAAAANIAPRRHPCMHVCAHARTAINLGCGNKMCLEAMMNQYENPGKKNMKKKKKQNQEQKGEPPAAEVLDACFEVAASFAKDDSHSNTRHLHGRIHAEIREKRLRAAKDYPDGAEAIKSKLGGTVVCISASYYGAHAVECANDDLGLDSHRCDLVVKKMRDEIESCKKQLRDGAHADKGKRKTLFFLIANLTLQVKLFTDFFTDDCQLCFKRNWSIRGTPFCSTWTAGWCVRAPMTTRTTTTTITTIPAATMNTVLHHREVAT